MKKLILVLALSLLFTSTAYADFTLSNLTTVNNAISNARVKLRTLNKQVDVDVILMQYDDAGVCDLTSDQKQSLLAEFNAALVVANTAINQLTTAVNILKN